MRSSQRLVQCPKCRCLVRSDRLTSHSKKVHHNQKLDVNRAEFTKEAPQNHKFFKADKFKQVESLIHSWLRREKSYLCNSSNVEILTIMACENFIGYSFDEINKFYGDHIQKDSYQTGVNRLKVTYEQMMDHLYETLIPYTKNYSYQKTKNQYYFENNEPDDYIDWYACNSVDRMDGSKYIGYHRREYEDRRFGSFPICDDYSEESWPDDNPWE